MLTVKELMDYLKDCNQNSLINIVVVDERGTKRVNVADYNADKEGIYLTGCITNEPYIYDSLK